MRILHVIPTYLPTVRYGGPIVSVHGLCKALAKRGHEVHVFTTNVDGPLDSDVPLDARVDLDGVNVRYFPTGYLRRLYRSPDMAKAFATHMSEFDLAHLHSIFLWPTWAAARAAIRARVPYIVAPRGMLEKDLIRRKSRLVKLAWIAMIERRNLERAAAIHVTSQREAAEAAAFEFKLPRVFDVPNGVDPAEPVPSNAVLSPLAKSLIERGPFLLFLGRINWKKGLDRLISALRHAPTISLVIAGNDEESYQPTLMAQAAAQGVSERVIFAGSVQGIDKAALLQNAQALVLPSYSENFGNVVLEAMAAGCPVIVTPEVGIADIVRETGAGWVVQGDAPTLGAGISDLLANPIRLREMGNRGRKAVEERYTWNAVARRMELGYLQVLAERGALSAARI